MFSQLISIFMILLHTFSMGVKTDARLPRSERFASIMRSGVFFVSAGILQPFKKMGRAPGLKKVNELVCSKRDHSHFCNGSNTPARAAGGGKNETTHIDGANCSLLGSRALVFTPICHFGGVVPRARRRTVMSSVRFPTSTCFPTALGVALPVAIFAKCDE